MALLLAVTGSSKKFAQTLSLRITQFPSFSLSRWAHPPPSMHSIERKRRSCSLGHPIHATTTARTYSLHAGQTSTVYSASPLRNRKQQKESGKCICEKKGISASQSSPPPLHLSLTLKEHTQMDLHFYIRVRADT